MNLVYKNKGIIVDPTTINESSHPRSYWYSDDKEIFDLRNVDFDAPSLVKPNESHCARLNTPSVIYKYSEFFSPVKATKSPLSDVFYSVRLFKVMKLDSADSVNIMARYVGLENVNGVKAQGYLFENKDEVDIGDTILAGYERKTKSVILIYNVTKKRAYRYGCETLGNFAKT